MLTSISEAMVAQAGLLIVIRKIPRQSGLISEGEMDSDGRGDWI